MTATPRDHHRLFLQGKNALSFSEPLVRLSIRRSLQNLQVYLASFCPSNRKMKLSQGFELGNVSTPHSYQLHVLKMEGLWSST